MNNTNNHGPLNEHGGQAAPAAHRRAESRVGHNAALLFALAGCLALTPAAFAASPKPVKLHSAAFFVILTKTGIADVPGSAIVGNVGTTPITGAADHLTCTEVVGVVLSVDAAGPAPCNRARPSKLGLAVGDMAAAYTDAAGRTPGVTELGSGNIGGLTIAPGVYKWGTGVLIPSNVTLKGPPGAVWIFQVSKDVDMASSTAVILQGGAQARNIFWQVAGKVTIGTGAKFQGVILSKTLIAMKTGATLTGRMYAQTAVTLEMNAVTKP